MGDHRSNSADSRTFGPVEVEQIIGRAWLALLAAERVRHPRRRPPTRTSQPPPREAGDAVNPILAGVALAVIAGAIVVVSVRDPRIVVLATTVVLLLSAVLADPMATPVGPGCSRHWRDPGRLPAVDRRPRPTRRGPPAGPDRRVAHRLAGRGAGGRRGGRRRVRGAWPRGARDRTGARECRGLRPRGPGGRSRADRPRRLPRRPGPRRAHRRGAPGPRRAGRDARSPSSSCSRRACSSHSPVASPRSDEPHAPTASVGSRSRPNPDGHERAGHPMPTRCASGRVRPPATPDRHDLRADRADAPPMSLLPFLLVAFVGAVIALLVRSSSARRDRRRDAPAPGHGGDRPADPPRRGPGGRRSRASSRPSTCASSWCSARSSDWCWRSSAQRLVIIATSRP